MHLLRKLAHRPVSPISNGGDVCRPFNPPTTPDRPNGDDNHIPRHSAAALQPSSYGFVASLNWPVTAEHRIGLGNSAGRGPCPLWVKSGHRDKSVRPSTQWMHIFGSAIDAALGPWCQVAR